MTHITAPHSSARVATLLLAVWLAPAATAQVQRFIGPSPNITTTLDMDFIPWPSFYERVAASLTSGEQSPNPMRRRS